MENYLSKLNQCRALEHSLTRKFIKHKQNVILYYSFCGADSDSLSSLRRAFTPSDLNTAVTNIELDVDKRFRRLTAKTKSLDSDIRKFTELYKSIDLPF